MDGLRAPVVLHSLNESYTYDYDVVVPMQGMFFFFSLFKKKLMYGW